MRVLLDMDEVLADFVGGVARSWNVPLEKIIQHWEPGVYDIVPPLSKVVGVGIPETTFWRHTEFPGFWRTLDELSWARELVETVSRATDDWYVVTSPSRGPNCVPEKQAWLNNFIYNGVGWFDRMIPTGHKHLLAKADGKPVLLIDDRDATIDRFRAAGGSGIILPRHHNRLHALSGDPFAHVKAELEKFLVTGETTCT